MEPIIEKDVYYRIQEKKDILYIQDILHKNHEPKISLPHNFSKENPRRM